MAFAALHNVHIQRLGWLFIQNVSKKYWELNASWAFTEMF
jgi:hypothetical protein